MINCIYIHIPFCKKKCKYCSFCSFELLKYKDEYINSLTKEIKHFYKPKNPLKTIYFGGGTPYLLDIADFETILSNFKFDANTEITLEINPYNVSLDKLKSLKALGINRISLGVQSFNNKILAEIGRLHNSFDILKSIDFILASGFENWSLDLIYGLPYQDMFNWSKTLDRAIRLNPKHISLYGLKIEEGSYYFKNPPQNIASSDLQAKMYELAIEKLKQNYLHYEFSNFAKSESYFSKHNLAYWKRENYYGFGLSASGFIENKRYTNTFNFKKYLKNPMEKEYEILDKKKEVEEEIFLGLRKTDGIDFSKIKEKYDTDVSTLYKDIFNKFISDGFMKKTQNGVKLTLKGILVSNEILCEFIEI